MIWLVPASGGGALSMQLGSRQACRVLYEAPGIWLTAPFAASSAVPVASEPTTRPCLSVIRTRTSEGAVKTTALRSSLGSKMTELLTLPL